MTEHLDPDFEPHSTESLDPDWLEARILQHIQRPNYHPVKPRVIAKQLGLSPDARSDVRKAIRRLSKRGKLRFGAKHLVRPLDPPRSAPATPPSDSRARSEANSPSAGGKAVELDSRKWWEGSSESDEPWEEAAEEAAWEEQYDSDSDVDNDVDRDVEEDRDSDLDRDAEFDVPRKGRRAHKGGAEVVGTFRRASGGYGFVRPQDATREEGRARDIYVSAKRSLDASSGDVVLVRLSKRRGKRGGKSDSDQPRIHGTILEVIRREDHRFVGNFFERGGSSLVQVDGRLFQQPIPVGDPGAKNVRPGDQVVIEMVRFPTHYDPGEGVVIEVLGPRGAPGVDTLAIMREYDLPDAFPEQVLENARQQAAQFDESIPPDRRDLTEVTVITIDPVDARDFDDAISLDQLENGHWLLGYILRTWPISCRSAPPWTARLVGERRVFICLTESSRCSRRSSRIILPVCSRIVFAMPVRSSLR
jgi:ribonuclease R